MPIVPIVSQGQHNLGRGKGHCLHHAFEEGKEEKIAEMLKTPNNPEPSEEAIPQAKQYAVKAAGRR